MRTITLADVGIVLPSLGRISDKDVGRTLVVDEFDGSELVDYLI